MIVTNTSNMKKYLQTIMISALFVLPILVNAQEAGTIDMTFGTDGVVLIDNGYTDLFTDVKIQEDQKIVAIGITYDAAWVASAQAMRFMPDGSLDMDFANDGVFTYSLNYEANVFGCLIKEDGKILMTGSTTDYNDYKIMLIQLNSDGSLDDTFGNNGVVVQKVSTLEGYFEDHSYDLVMQDNKILVAGRSTDENYRNSPVVIRFNEDGSLDNTFGIDGVARISVVETDNVFDCISIDNDGKIVAAGHYAVDLLQFSMLVARFTADGILDDTFNDDGVFIHTLGADAEAYGMGITSNNDIVVSGFTASSDYNYSMLMMQIDGEGMLDVNFGDNGIVISDMGQYDVASAMIIQEDGKILASGGTGAGAPGDAEIVVWRYNPEGTPDITFGTDGISKIQLTSGVDEALGMALHSNGNIVLAGKSRNEANNFDYFLLRMYNDLTISINEIESNTGQMISPNPVAFGRLINLRYNLSEASDVQVEVYNSIGTLVDIIDLGSQNSGKQINSISASSSLAPGSYFVRVRANGELNSVSKLIVTL